jgi:hypothetical protein
MWLVRANVVFVRSFGRDGDSTSKGLRLFRPGAKVVVVRLWRNASPERVTVVGRHRSSLRYVSCIVQTTHLCNLRLELVRSPYVIAHHWERPEQLHNYGRDRQAALDALAELIPRADGRARA